MRWISNNLLQGMQAFFASPFNDKNEDAGQTTIQSVRQAMLKDLAHLDKSMHASVERRIVYANDLQDLWYLRGEVMAAIAAVDGEMVAREKIHTISAMFKGHLPRGLTARLSHQHY